MRRFNSILSFAAITLIASAAAADRVIPPYVPASLLSQHSVALPPVIDRSDARELMRLNAVPLVVEEQSGTVVEGAVRPFERPVRVEIPRAAANAPAILGRITVDGARAIRLRFSDVPAETVLWVAGSEDEELIRFEPSSTAQWGPTTRGSIVFIAAEGGTGTIEIAELAQIAQIPDAQASCLSDIACRSSEDYAAIEEASRAIGYMRFIRDGTAYVCTGGLLNNVANSGAPFFLTAQHCISTQEEAASVEVVWDLRSEACGSNRMAKVSRSHGAELLVASRTTDVALLRLSAVPADRVFLGIDTRPLAAQTIVHRISHAGGLSQTYSSAIVEGSGMTCPGAARPQFTYTRLRAGATSGGSSGAPLLLPGLYVTGQLRGTCGPDPGNSCATYNSGVDGTLRESWPLLAPYLDPGMAARRRAVRR